MLRQLAAKFYEAVKARRGGRGSGQGMGGGGGVGEEVSLDMEMGKAAQAFARRAAKPPFQLPKAALAVDEELRALAALEAPIAVGAYLAQGVRGGGGGLGA